ncbi:MAG: DNA mismatch repair protein MutS [Candidatus Raymondbacteria bacterium RifOxyA12_full_50_37]|uniref:DNA mismatch repair protein MutS n=1 Tax=Candidatus Raymondbacteria bacterium RIFOXYD12_FULL_49_13 TaxID=1817890 RepID=A0A1F7FBT6_UNCRA|nr:MAG: DNA mismatch repair protein MutS [Candidatus Raymondbacteria bacterium RifOxyA12_full_50_37]OGJ92447.1 MAG: DNA mismatch repair protein MutS [Candidatus Raymondbacteria bacterium RIFOXYA2_FULL_49_16]OGJ95248.1 MAG: DNA mismatch repair protein MutS [Candidatus Raymondbacteria bacterium RIFOXYC2_FULL_50_21]OGK04088.1 MAG: DNA mismatch repair protein MutS [Candidatus Raymondbacteria bacterium RIFOXYD12_FULL_49_13]OGP39490.1 MAG: DNA mismatch repair protein MutS [Candidatus Raymondbacteria 
MATPLMAQYRRVKEQHPGSILLYRMGDFYEMFEEDAVTASKILGLTLTSRNHGEDAKTPLCGFPYHALDRYSAKLVQAGRSVAVCEQTENPKEAKGIVKRDIVEVITRGTATAPEVLSEKSNNFLVSVCKSGDRFGFAGADVSTGEFFCADMDSRTLTAECEKLSPAEILVPDEKPGDPVLAQLREALASALFTPIEPWRFSPDSSYRDLVAHFRTSSLEGFGVEPFKAGIAAAGVLFNYIKEQKKNRVGHINRLAAYAAGEHMQLDGATIRNFELVTPLHEEDRASTLLSVIDRTQTAMGARLLRRLTVNPLLSRDRIIERQDGVAFFADNTQVCATVRTALSSISDIERLTGRIGYERVGPRDLVALRSSLAKVQEIEKILAPVDCPIIASAVHQLKGTEVISNRLEQAVRDDPPLTLAEGNIFKPGYNADLDAIVAGSKTGKEWIASLQAQERERTGISSLKVGFNQVFGYYIEVSNANTAKVPPHYIRKQTLVNGERYITEELKKWEEVVLHAEEKQIALEQKLFAELRTWLCSHAAKLTEVSVSVALIDVLACLAEVAIQRRYVRPEMDESGEISIIDGRHPVIESIGFIEEYVPNSIEITGSGEFIHLITGPNMAGKSTYLRQTGLIVLLAHMGSFVPAAAARIGIVDRIFTRVGASDRLSKGQSTFLVEMQELANILNNATSKSLILLDEIGRGTSTFDGLSIAWALVEHIHKKVKAKTLFATHYHELAEIPLLLKGVKNFNIAVKEWNDEVIFLRRIEEGACDHSYGIQVARLAGVPKAVIERAKEVLNNLESSELTPDNKPVIGRSVGSRDSEAAQMSLFEPLGDEAIAFLRKIDLNVLTPVEVVGKLVELKNRLSI